MIQPRPQSRRRAARALAAGTLAIAGLSSQACLDTDSCGSLGEPTLELGIGEFDYAPLPADGVLHAVMGVQGGSHVWGSLRATGVLPGNRLNAQSSLNPIVSFVLVQDGLDVAGYRNLPRAFSAASGDAYELTGDALILYVQDATMLSSSPITMTAVLDDACGTHLEASATVTVLPD